MFHLFTGWIHTGSAMLIVRLITVVLAAALIRYDWQLSVKTILGNKAFTLSVSVITLSILLVLLSGSHGVGGDVSLTCRSTATCAATMSTVRNWAAVFSVICIAAVLANTLLAVPAMKSGAADLLREKLFVKLVSWTLHLTAGISLWMTLVALWVSVILGAKRRQSAAHTI